MISRRDIFGMTVGLTSAGWLRAQNTERAVSVGVSVTDEEGRSINDLKSSDFRVLEDDILQKIQTFTTKPLVDHKPADEAGKAGASPRARKGENFYMIIYYPDPSNHNEGYRIIKVEIVPDV